MALKANSSSHNYPLLEKIFVEEYLRIRCNPVPEFGIEFFPYRGLTNTIRIRGGLIRVRLSDLLIDAPDKVLRSSVAILLHKVLCSKVPKSLRLFYHNYCKQPEMRERIILIRRRRGRKRLVSPVGGVFDLRSVFRDLNRTYFDNRITVRHLSWSLRKNRRALGHFDAAHNAIVINRRLDSHRVPGYVLSFVLYHEMLHAYLGEELSGSQRRIHHRRFQLAEQRFAHYSKAKDFIRNHLYESRKR